MKGLFFFKKNKGFTMLEMVIAAFILTVGIIGAYSAFARITIATSIISSKLTAAYLAQEGIEIIRNIRDANWLQGFEWDNTIVDICADRCEADYTTGTVNQTTALRYYTGAFLVIDADGFYSYSSGSPTRFTRRITVRPDGPIGDFLRVSILVQWNDRGKSYNFTAEENLYNWH